MTLSLYSFLFSPIWGNKKVLICEYLTFFFFIIFKVCTWIGWYKWCWVWIYAWKIWEHIPFRINRYFTRSYTSIQLHCGQSNFLIRPSKIRPFIILDKYPPEVILAYLPINCVLSGNFFLYFFMALSTLSLPENSTIGSDFRTILCNTNHRFLPIYFN